MKIKKLAFDNYGRCWTETASGKEAYVQENEFNLNRLYYTLYIEDKLVFTRGTLARVMQELLNK